jgi:hypothetical protein
VIIREYSRFRAQQLNSVAILVKTLHRKRLIPARRSIVVFFAAAFSQSELTNFFVLLLICFTKNQALKEVKSGKYIFHSTI